MQDGSLDDGNPNAGVGYTIVKAGTIYTITDSNGTTVFQGKNKAPIIKSGRMKNKNKHK